jgi:aminomethyltransferase
MSTLRCTPLRDFHAAHGARLVDFAGWEMPVQYHSILEEHKAVRRAAGLFDVSHMGEVAIEGSAALAYLQRLLPNDIARLAPGGVLYSPMCHASGGTVDDLLVYRRGPDEFLLCINAGNIAKDLAWLREQSAGFAVTLADRSDAYALLALQGPRALEILQPLTRSPLAQLRYYHFCEGTVAGTPCLISRTGYTGEDGFELYHAPDAAPRLAQTLLDAGTPHGMVLAGLGARDSLRLEAGYPLHGHELSDEISPLAAGLGWTVKFDKGIDFIGRAALQAEKLNGSPRRVIFFRTGDRRIVRHDTPVLGATGATVGQVLSGTLSPILNEAIGSALIDSAATNKALTAEIRGTAIALHRVQPPFIPLKKSP